MLLEAQVPCSFEVSDFNVNVSPGISFKPSVRSKLFDYIDRATFGFLPKTRISFFVHRLQGLQLSIPLTGSFRNQDLEKITKIQSLFFL